MKVTINIEDVINENPSNKNNKLVQLYNAMDFLDLRNEFKVEILGILSNSNTNEELLTSYYLISHLKGIVVNS